MNVPRLFFPSSFLAQRSSRAERKKINLRLVRWHNVCAEISAFEKSRFFSSLLFLFYESTRTAVVAVNIRENTFPVAVLEERQVAASIPISSLFLSLFSFSLVAVPSRSPLFVLSHS